MPADDLESIRAVHASFQHAADDLESNGHPNDYLRRGALVEWLRNPATAAGKMLADLMAEVTAGSGRAAERVEGAIKLGANPAVRATQNPEETPAPAPHEFVPPTNPRVLRRCAFQWWSPDWRVQKICGEKAEHPIHGGPTWICGAFQTNVPEPLLPLRCTLPHGHTGKHSNVDNDEQWGQAQRADQTQEGDR